MSPAFELIGEEAEYQSLVAGTHAVRVVPLAGDPVIPGLTSPHVHRGAAFEMLVTALPLTDGWSGDIADTDEIVNADLVGARLRPASGDRLVVAGVSYVVHTARFADAARLVWRLETSQG